jgi:hypothetical protein
MIPVTISQHQALLLAIVAGTATAAVLGLLSAGSVTSTASDATTHTHITTLTFNTFARVESSGPKCSTSCLFPSLIPIPSSTLALATGALDTTPNDDAINGSESVARALTDLRSGTSLQDRRAVSLDRSVGETLQCRRLTFVWSQQALLTV